MTNDNLIKLIKRELLRHKDIELAYLFGSAAKRSFSKAKDVDVAIFLKRKLSPIKKLEYQNKIANVLGKIVGKNVDAVIVNDTSAFLRNQVIKYGVLIFERSKNADSRFRYNAISDYCSVKPLHDFFAERMEKRFLGAKNGR